MTHHHCDDPTHPCPECRQPARPTRHVTITLTEREADQMASGDPDARALLSIRRKCNHAVHALRSERFSPNQKASAETSEP
jgi:hypothetical protein